MKIAFQQMMIGTICKNFDTSLTSLKKLKEMGFDAIELNSFMIHKSSFIVRLLTSLAKMPVGKCGKYDWHKLITLSNLEVASLHIDLGSLERNTEEVCLEAKSFNTTNLVITGMYRFDYSSKEEVKKLCERLNNVGKKVLEYGCHLMYHNHNVEYKRFSDGTRCFDFIVNNTSPDYVNFEYDSYWPQEAGANIVSEMIKIKNRLKLHHINDRGFRDKGPYMTPIVSSSACELGSGNMPLEELIKIDNDATIDYIILEQHNNFINNNVLESMNLSINYLKKRI